MFSKIIPPRRRSSFTKETAGPAVREYIASYCRVVPEIVTDELDLYVDLLSYSGEFWGIRDGAEELFYEGLCRRFSFDIQDDFDFDRHFPELNYPGIVREREMAIYRGLLFFALSPLILLLSIGKLLLSLLGVPDRFLGVNWRDSEDLPKPLPRELLPDNYVPLTVGEIVRAVETGVLVVDYGDEAKPPPE